MSRVEASERPVADGETRPELGRSSCSTLCCTYLGYCSNYTVATEGPETQFSLGQRKLTVISMAILVTRGGSTVLYDKPDSSLCSSLF
ncbi:hypothetical protein COCON_G00057980 [Conger conger]|uniref:Uncharacterized protein n=1 Tax=Conger conger TaxID=82655 RepID=A0A9Q1I1H4_CONCO|nr:hypothetical protein COCON_G00057980 [Conger conger]